MEADYNLILDYILEETIKRKNEHYTVKYSTGEYKATRIVPDKELVEKFGIELYEADIMYYELTSESLVNYNTGNATLKGLEFYRAGGFRGRRRRETISAVLQSLETVLIVLGTVCAGAYGVVEIWKYFHPCH
jgi:hypothetical protein